MGERQRGSCSFFLACMVSYVNGPLETQTNPYQGICYLMFSTFPGNFFFSFLGVYMFFVNGSRLAFFQKTYGFKVGVGGLTYLGLGVGFLLSTLFGAKAADWIYTCVSNYLFQSVTGVSMWPLWSSQTRTEARVNLRCVYRPCSSARSLCPLVCCTCNHTHSRLITIDRSI